MEWIKLRTMQSTWWTLALSAVAAAVLAVTIGVNTRNAHGDLTNNALAGMIPPLLLTGVLGILTMTGEYSSGMIRATLAAVPHRPLLMAAKAAVFGAAALVVGEAAAFLAFFAGSASLPASIRAPSLADPGVARAVLLSGTSFCLVGLIGLGLGAVIRHTGVAVAVLIGGVYVGAQILGFFTQAMLAWLPILIIGNSLSTTQPENCPAHAAMCPRFLSPWAGLGVLCLYAAVALVAGGWVLTRRDA
ncbi:MAG TPA: hypothetical protein VGS19_17925 [Streptosporangiaceae bacterium]|nr:hypothetical protein [Streptosporangiaceae bacterium]